MRVLGSANVPLSREAGSAPQTERIAIFLPSLVGGGAERVMLNLAGGIAARGFQVDLVLARATGPYLSRIPDGVRVLDLGARRVLSSMPGLVAYLRRTRPTALISALWHANLVSLWARQVARVPTRVVMTAHNTLSQGVAGTRLRRAKLTPLLLRVFGPAADGIVAVSRGVADDLVEVGRLPPERVSIIFNPVVRPDARPEVLGRPDHPWFDPEGPPVLLAVGRLTWEKDFETFLRALARVRERRPIRGIILGEGPERAALEELCRRLDLDGDVEMPGFVADPEAYMAHAAVFVMSSRTEGLPTVLIEALAAGAPVVSTDCPSGPREVLRDGEFGPLVPVGDVEALASAILGRLAEPRRSAPAEAWEPYTLEAAVEGYLRLLELNAHA